jgi:tetratricopeptide (TPR) repeat protein
MLPTDSKPTASPQGKGVRRRHRREKPPWILRIWWLFPLVAVALSAQWISTWWTSRPGPRHLSLPGYTTDADSLRQEFRRFQGKPLGDPAIEQDFDRASDLMNQGEYSSAAVLLETIARPAPLPVIYNNLGVLYVRLNDGTKAVGAFREVLARDFEYPPARQNLARFKLGNFADPVTREVEPNGTDRIANVISLGRSVDAEISPDVNDVDCFRVTSPPAPRDLLLVELANRSQTLAPRLRLYDADDRPLDWSKESQEPGASLREVIAPLPNTTLFLRIEGLIETAGAYSLTVSPMKAFDAFEPNDDILNATKIGLDQIVEANIMDGDDTDYYSFHGSERGAVTIEIQNRSKTLIPALTTFTPEMTNNGFGPILTAPGSELHFSMKVEAGKTYYIQVWGQSKTAGEYSLTVK